MSDSLLRELVELSNKLGADGADLAILAEGNTSARIDEETFWVKASGFSLGTIGEGGFVRVRFAPILEAMSGELDDAGVRALLGESRADATAKILPSVETFMHAYLLSLPGVGYIGHTHPTPLLSLLSLNVAQEVSGKRLFPDEIVCCGPASAFVPYVDPGLVLAQAVKDAVESYVEEWGGVPKTVWMQNHGLIALGKTPKEVESATFMAVKAARAWLGALSAGCDLHPLSAEQVSRIHTRPDEHYRQQLLWQLQGKAS